MVIQTDKEWQKYRGVPKVKQLSCWSICYPSLSKTYNMAGWRVGFMVGNAKLIGALEKIKSWLDYGTFTPIQVASTIALTEDQSCVQEICEVYRKRRDVMVKSFITTAPAVALQKPKRTCQSGPLTILSAKASRL